jgi:hypothetical protein
MDDSPEIKVTIAFHPVKMTFEAGSIDEAVAALTSMAPKLREARGLDLGGQEGEALSPDSPEYGKGANNPAASTAPKARKPRAGKDPATASAPPPLPVPAPGNEPEATPAFLQRAATPPPVPPLPGAPPVAPAPPAPPLPPNPNSGVALAVKAKVLAHGDSILPWLVQNGFVNDIPGLILADAAECMLYLSPEKLTAAAKALSVPVG